MEKVSNLLTLVLVPLVIGVNIFSIFQLRNFVVDNQRGVLVARQDNRRRQEEIKNYVRCILLLRFEIAQEDFGNEKVVTEALDRCANDSIPKP